MQKYSRNDANNLELSKISNTSHQCLLGSGFRTMTVHYFTVFDKNYAARGLIMLDSLRRASTGPIQTYVLALDAEAHRVALGNATTIMLVEDLQDQEFLNARTTRSNEEFCWTCAPVLSNFILQNNPVGDFAVYLDADLYFFSDPAVLLAEMGDDKNIIIHPHRFSPDRVAWERTAGIFNVGFVGFRISDEARACADRWRTQVLDLCVKDPEKGLCGDQGYLNEWPSLYSGLRIMENIGGGTAPWNVNAYEVGGSPEMPTVNGQPIVFFHFHQLRIADRGSRRFAGAIYAIGYDLSEAVGRLIYHRYVQRLKQESLRLQTLGIPLRSDLNYDAFTFFSYLSAGQVQSTNRNLNTLVRQIAPVVSRAVHLMRAGEKLLNFFPQKAKQ